MSAEIEVYMTFFNYECKFPTFTFVVEVMFNIRTFSQVLAKATVIKLFKCSILYTKMYINSLNVE